MACDTDGVDGAAEVAGAVIGPETLSTARALGYDPEGPEQLKIWPTIVNIEMPKMIRNETDLVHRVYFDSFEQIEEKRYHIKTHSNVNELLQINGETPLYVL